MVAPNTLYKLVNPPVIRLLRSPLHGLMSRNTMVLEFTGRKSGRPLATPVSYFVENDRIHAFASKATAWWQNIAARPDVHITVRGRRLARTATVVVDDPEPVASAMDRFLRVVPRDAKYSGVKLLPGGIPDPDDLRRIAPSMVYVHFPLGDL